MAWTAKDGMSRGIAVVESSATIAELERSFAEAKVSGFPVVENGRVVGVISRTDVLQRLGHDLPGGCSSFYGDPAPGHDHELSMEALAAGVDELTVADLMTRSIIDVEPDDDLVTVAKTLVSSGVHRVLVVDDDVLVGMLSSLDLVRLIAEGQLEG